jgi:SAM-dependent methyltransferase
MALRRFTLQAAGGFRGRDASESFARALLECFGVSSDDLPEGLTFSYAFPVVDHGKRTQRTVSAYWEPRRVVVDVVERDAMLDMAWSDLLRACLQMDKEPQYVVLTNQRDVRLYDLARDRAAPRLSIALDELPKYSEALVFFEPDWVPGTTPKIINVDKVSKAVADLVAKVYRALLAKNPERGEDVIRFTLQCIIAMFAEDIGLLPKEYFTTLLYRAAEDGGGGGELLAELFRLMSTDEPNDSGIPFFNGGLFTDPVTCDLKGAPLKALTKAAEANWTFVDPHIFGSVFQGIMDSAERHASGAHYTAREDIMSVVGPTIVEPWRERISAATTLADLKQILADLASYRVLDPACGSGNFLYVAFRELYRLETEVLCRAYEFASVQKGASIGWASGIRTTNFFGIDINPFAVELAKTTLNIAKKIAFDERKATVVELFGQGFLEVDPSLPLDNLDDNIRCADALFADWPVVDAIVGNPPILGDRKIRGELGPDYIGRLRDSSGVQGLVDLCCYWFRRAHDRTAPSGRAGLVGTSGIRVGKAREASLDYITANGGTITDAISSIPWSGDAALNVSIVNWVRDDSAHVNKLVVDGRIYAPSRIASHLQLHGDIGGAKELNSNREGTALGVIFGASCFDVDAADAPRDVSELLRPIAAGTALLTGRLQSNPDYCIYAGGIESESEMRLRPATYEVLAARARPAVAAKAKKYPAWPSRWWQPLRPQTDFFAPASRLQRLVACSNPQARPVFVLLSTRFVPTNTLQLFAYDDDYTFGIIQSSLHWEWAKAKGGRLTDRIRYTSEVWKTFPWPQEPSGNEVESVAVASRALRATRDRLMAENGWSLRALYQSAEVSGPHPLKDAQAALDAAVEAAYGKPDDQEATEFLLEMNLALAEDEAAGRTIQGPGLPAGLDPKDPRWFSTDCIEPPPLPGLEDTESGGD